MIKTVLYLSLGWPAFKIMMKKGMIVDGSWTAGTFDPGGQVTQRTMYSPNSYEASGQCDEKGRVRGLANRTRGGKGDKDGLTGIGRGVDER